MSVGEQDQLLILDYLDGRLSTDRMLGFEIRLGNEPALASAFESFEALDQLERRLAMAKARPAQLRFLRGGLRLGSIAVAGLLILALGLWLTKDRRGAEQSRLAVLTSGKDWIEFNRELGLSDEWIDVDPSALRSGQQADVTHQEYYDHIAPLQEQRLQQALQGEQERLEVEFFNLVLQPQEACSAIVLLSDARGVVLDAEGRPFQIAYPKGSPWSRETGRLAAGELVVLPGRNARWSAERAALEPFAPGFLVSQGAGQLEVFVALRADGFDDTLRRSLQGVLENLSSDEKSPRATGAALRSWFDSAGFELRVLEVKERENQ